MELEKGTIISVINKTSDPETYMLTERVTNLGYGNGSGWVCIDMNALIEKGSENISGFDCWKISDSYLEMQIQRGVIKIVEQNED